MIVKVGPVDCGMTAGAETSPLRQTSRMHLFTDNRKIHLSMASEAQIIVAGNQHFGVHGSVNLMASRTAFADSLMFKDKRAPLFFVTIEASFIDAV